MNEDLVKRFAPILFLHPDDKFLPSSPKRYLENASLWKATSPFSNKTSWTKIVSAGDLAGVAGDGPTVIDDVTVSPANANEEMFLELGGWLDADGGHDGDVTPLSGNLYADRAAIASDYSTSPLANVSPWYHAEIYNGDRLKAMVDRVSPPDLSRFLTDGSALLFYYFYFPAHEQSVGGDTSFCAGKMSAQEAACHAGDWQCMAIFLELDGDDVPENYTPKFLGLTGSRPDGSVVPSGRINYFFDDDNLTVMKVTRWQPAQAPAAGMPQVDGTHPRLYVARGSHSLYTSTGDQAVAVFPDGQASQWCAAFDTPSVMPTDWGQTDDTGKDIGAFIAKVFGGFLVGGPFGEAAGLLAGAIENVKGINVTGTQDIPDPDKVPTVDEGFTIKPADVATVTGVSKTPTDWAVRQGFQSSDGRSYDYLVDRDKERWWPNDDSEHGYRGRWGQRVAADALPRRSGPRFPNYLKTFLLAIAAADSSGALDPDV